MDATTHRTRPALTRSQVPDGPRIATRAASEDIYIFTVRTVCGSAPGQIKQTAVQQCSAEKKKNLYSKTCKHFLRGGALARLKVQTDLLELRLDLHHGDEALVDFIGTVGKP